MKTFLLAVLGVCAFSGLHMTAFADSNANGQDVLRPADEMAQMDGLDQSDVIADDANGMDTLLPPPPHHPYPPHPVPHPYPPHPYPPHPYPPYHPAPQWWYECTSQDQYNRTYSARGQDPRWVQQDVHNHCEYMSNGPCWDLGCRRY